MGATAPRGTGDRVLADAVRPWPRFGPFSAPFGMLPSGVRPDRALGTTVAPGPGGEGAMRRFLLAAVACVVVGTHPLDSRGETGPPEELDSLRTEVRSLRERVEDLE